MIYVPLFYEAVFDQPPRTIEREELGRKKKKKKSSSSFLFNRNFTNIANWLFYPMGFVVERETHPTPSPTPKPNAMTSLLLN